MVLAIFLLQSQVIKNPNHAGFIIYRLCIDGYEYVMTKGSGASSHIIVQSLVQGTARMPSPKKCEQKDKK